MLVVYPATQNIMKRQSAVVIVVRSVQKQTQALFVGQGKSSMTTIVVVVVINHSLRRSSAVGLCSPQKRTSTNAGSIPAEVAI